MAPDRVFAFALLAFVLIVVPGPSVLFVVGRALSSGRRAALATVAGNDAGEYVQALAVAAGLGLVLERSDLVFTAVKLAGAAYLAYLGLVAIRDRKAFHASSRAAVRDHGDRRAFRDGFIVGLTNPKTTIFFAAVLPQFVTTSPGAAPVPAQMMVLGAVFVAIALVSDSAWGLAASRARDWFARSPRRLEALHAMGGAVMVGLAARLALTSRAD